MENDRILEIIIRWFVLQFQLPIRPFRCVSKHIRPMSGQQGDPSRTSQGHITVFLSRPGEQFD
jgi:hypothetical protein